MAASSASAVFADFSQRGVATAPGGSHPSYALGYSARDNDYYQAWDAISRDRDRFQRWLADEVYGEAGSLASAGAGEGG